MGTIAEKLQYTLNAINDIQQALIDRGLSVADTDELATYADKIRSIKISDGLLITSDATATAENILKGKTAYARMEKITGTMSNWGSLEITPEVNVIDASTPLPDETPFCYLGGHYDGITVTPKTIKLADYTPATATAEDIAEGKTAWINGVLVEGTMKTEWTLLETVTAKTAITLPESFTELHLVVENSTRRFVYNILYDELSTKEKGYISGGYYGSTGYQRAFVNVSLTSCHIANVAHNGTNTTSNSTLTVYYR